MVKEISTRGKDLLDVIKERERLRAEAEESVTFVELKLFITASRMSPAVREGTKYRQYKIAEMITESWLMTMLKRK